MATKDYIENSFDSKSLHQVELLKIGIVVSDWHHDVTSKLKTACVETLIKSGIKEDNISIISVPGAFELTMGARILLSSQKMDAVICLGCVIKGETNHDEYINQAVASGITNLGLSSGKPVIFGLLTVLNKKQAEDRAGGTYGNKGTECANSALQMIGIKQQFSEPKSKIGFS
ncbi:MAG: 6,7-dimethyl-8-ribityllumazine synthase [Saprospiraceae bacterium]|jgi:6,7-dimethyl-8-ribityllumazine synthase|nr:6,7-dimethyl-8-ribityllumazine synthase [Saprospiraceae bacterium]